VEGTAGPSTSLRFGRDDKVRVVAFVWIGYWWREPQVPPLRYASVGMTRLGWLLSSGLDTGGGNRRSLHFATLRDDKGFSGIGIGAQ
jgi:hypothetical protein